MGYNRENVTESFGIPIQQICYVVNDDGKIRDNDRVFLNNIIPLMAIQKEYAPLTVDKIKWSKSFNSKYLERNYRSFMHTYLRIIVDNPTSALKGYGLATLGFWDITKIIPVGYINNFMWPGWGYEMKNLIVEELGFSLRPVLEPPIYLSCAVYAWVLIFVIMMCLSNKHYRQILPLIPGLGLWLSIMAATPIAFSLRYVLALVFFLGK